MSRIYGMAIEGITAYAPPYEYSNRRISARLRLERQRENRRLIRERSFGLTEEEAKKFETSDRWIKRFIGFFSRRIAPPGEGTIDLAVRASRLLLKITGRAPEEIDTILFGRVTPTYIYSPPDAALLQRELGIPSLRGGVPSEIHGADISLACSTWLASLRIAYALIRSGMAKHIILIGADKMSSTINWADRAFAAVLGDAGTATLLSATSEEDDWFSPNQFWGTMNGDFAEIIMTPKGGSKCPLRSEAEIQRYENCLGMDGAKVREIVVPLVGGPAIQAALKKARWKMSDIDLAILHEANRVMNGEIVKLWRSQGFRGEVLDAGGNFGNTTSASAALAVVLNASKLEVGKTIMINKFGGGLSEEIVLATIRKRIAIGCEVNLAA